MTRKGGFFEGIDRSVGEPMTIECHPITPEVIEQAAKAILEYVPIPCGTKEHPHLVSPGPRGGLTFCVECGAAGIRPRKLP